MSETPRTDAARGFHDMDTAVDAEEMAKMECELIETKESLKKLMHVIVSRNAADRIGAAIAEIRMYETKLGPLGPINDYRLAQLLSANIAQPLELERDEARQACAHEKEISDAAVIALKHVTAQNTELLARLAGTPHVLGHPADASWCEAVDAHHAATEAEMRKARHRLALVHTYLIAEWKRNALSSGMSDELIESLNSPV